MGRWPLWFHPGKKFEKSVGLEKALKIAFSNQCFPFIDIQLMYYDRKATPQVCELNTIQYNYEYYYGGINPVELTSFKGLMFDVDAKTIFHKFHFCNTQLGPPTLTYTFFNNPKAKSAFMGRVLDIMKKLQKLHDKKRWMPTEQEKLMITKVYELEKKINEVLKVLFFSRTLFFRPVLSRLHALLTPFYLAKELFHNTCVS